MPKKLFVIDAMAMAFRNYHAFGMRQITTSNGLPTSAIYGSAQFLLSLFEREHPDYCAVATDSKEPTFRHEMYEAYKANRTEMPEELAAQIPYLFKLFHALGCPLLKKPGHEADDLIGSLVKHYASPELHCYIVSGDKDFMQLVNDYIFLYAPKKGGEVQIIGTKEVYEKFGCRPDQVIDILAIIGDSSDNVPGVRGIGEKGAAKLIQQYGSLENIYQHIDEIKNKRQREALLEYKDLAFLSRKLVTIDTSLNDLPSLDELKAPDDHNWATEELLHLFEELEFRSLAEKVRKLLYEREHTQHKTQPAASQNHKAAPQTAQNYSKDYRAITTPDEWHHLIQLLSNTQQFAFDTETTGLSIIDDQPIGFSISHQKDQAFYIPLQENHLNKLMPSSLVKDLTAIVQNREKKKIGHNLKFDLQMMHNIHILVKPPLIDTMIAAHLLDSTSRSVGLDACCLRYLHYQKIPTSELIGKNAHKNMQEVPLAQITEYASEDADCCYKLWEVLEPMLKANKLEKVFYEIEMPLVPILAKMEQTGVYVDKKTLNNLSKNLHDQIEMLTQEIYELAGEEFNINSTKQLQVILFEKLKIHEQLGETRLKKTKSGISTDVSVLEKLADHPLAAKLLQYRMLTKLKSTYIDALPKLIHPKTQRIHTSFHQTGTATGRLSSSNPNLQNIPIRSPLGKEIRKAFCAQAQDSKIISADYSQIELRLLAHFSEDEHLIESFQQNKDIHRATAAKIFNVPEDEVSDELRSHAKAINFGIIYGMGPQRLAAQTGVSLSEAKDFIKRYFETYPKIKEYIHSAIEFARQTESTRTITGRRRPLKEIHSNNRAVQVNAENIAINSPLQGSAADLIKIAMISIDKAFEELKFKAKMVLQIHDELLFEVPDHEVADVCRVVKDKMESAMELKVPLVADIGVGKNWLEAH